MEEKMTSLDIAEIVWKAMGLEEEKEPVQVCEAPTDPANSVQPAS